MNKNELINAIREELEIERLPVKRNTIEAVVEALGRVAAQHLASVDAYCETEVVLPGLGKLKAVMRAARTGARSTKPSAA